MDPSTLDWHVFLPYVQNIPIEPDGRGQTSSTSRCSRTPSRWPWRPTKATWRRTGVEVVGLVGSSAKEWIQTFISFTCSPLWSSCSWPWIAIFIIFCETANALFIQGPLPAAQWWKWGGWLNGYRVIAPFFFKGKLVQFDVSFLTPFIFCCLQCCCFLSRKILWIAWCPRWNWSVRDEFLADDWKDCCHCRPVTGWQSITTIMSFSFFLFHKQRCQGRQCA